MHLIMDGNASDPEVLQNEKLIYDLLDGYPAKIDMHKITTPYVIRYVGVKPEDWGVSGIVLIAESHLSIHTFVERKSVNIDVFSCKDFDAQQAIRDFTEMLQLTDLKFRILNRDIGDPSQMAEGEKLTSVRA
jgi:S-adenosylmethionine decarboxylase